MPEGCYAAKMKKTRSVWKRPRLPWNSFDRLDADIRIEGGIPFQGKGENDYDCGDDGLWGTGCTGHNEAHAVAVVVESVLNSRKKYGTTGAVRNMGHVMAADRAAKVNA
jgi:hypothetical protein